MLREIERAHLKGYQPMSYAGRMPAQPKPEKDEPVKISLDPEEALRALLQVQGDEKSVPSETKHGTRRHQHDTSQGDMSAC